MITISKLKARMILDSRGIPTLETEVTLSDGNKLCASVPSGASVGVYEVAELRDNDMEHYAGKGVSKAIQNVNTIIAPKLTGLDPTKQKSIDELLIDLDSSENKSRLGANAILCTSIVVLKAGAYSNRLASYKYVADLYGNKELKLPKLLCNLINGGMHAGWNADIQEFMVILQRTTTIKEALAQVFRINNDLKKMLTEMGSTPLVGDEGGVAPLLSKNEDALSLLEKVVKSTGLTLGNDIFFGIDAAASSFYSNGGYKVRDIGENVSSADLDKFYRHLAERYPLMYLEDPFAEDDVEAWENFIKNTPPALIVTGDDLTVTNPAKLKLALTKSLIRGIIIKPNQIGTLTEAMNVCMMAKSAGIAVIVSHRSGETNDDFIADFAVGVGAQFAKFGAPVRGERVAKYNRLLEIEEELS